MDADEGPGLLFCRPSFHELNGVPQGSRWRHELRRGSRLVGALEGVTTAASLLSGHSAPFGGPDFVRQDPTLEDVSALVAGAVARARADGIESVTIRCRPSVYSATEPLLEYVLLQHGFEVAHCDVNQHVDLLPLRDGADPLLLLKSKRTPVRRALATPFELVEVAAGDDDGIATCHGVLAANRAAHGRPPGLSAAYLASVKRRFPDLVDVLLLRQGGGVVATAVVYRVLPDVALLVSWGDAARGEHPSAMDLLAHLLVVRAAGAGHRLLDLGPSSEKDGTPNTGLFNFKRSAGALPGTRKVMTVKTR